MKEITEGVTRLDVRQPCICHEADCVMNAVMTEIMATKMIRIGGLPDTVSQSAIQEVVGLYMKRGLPIPFLCPWGSEKPDGSGIDIAELCGLQTVMCLNERVRAHYNPGVIVNIRVEDVSAPHLYYDRMEEARMEAKRYTDGLVQLALVLGAACIVIKREADQVSEERFNQAADLILPLMERYIRNPDEVSYFAALQDIGWKGAMTREFIGEQMEHYARLYPNKDVETRMHILARYFSGALARNHTGIRGDDPSWGGHFLELGFLEPKQKAGGRSFSRRVHYRTMPTTFSSYHIAPWRAKGYVYEVPNGGIRPRLASFRDTSLKFNQAAVQLKSSDGRNSVVINSDVLTN